MARISVGAAIGAGFGLIRRRPLSVLAWGLVLAAFQAAFFAVLAPFYATLVGQFAQMAHPGAVPVAPTPEFMRMEGLVQLLNIAQLLVSAVVFCAVSRAVLRPEKSSFGYLRLGGPGFFLAALIFGATIAFFICAFLIAIPVVIVGALLAVVTHGAGLVAAVPLLMIAVFVAALVVALRFSLAGPMMVDDGKFHLLESWRLTRGKTGSLLLIALGLFGVLLAVDVVWLVVFLGVGAAAASSAGGVVQLLALIRQAPQTAFGKLAPLLAVYLALCVPLAGCVMAIVGAPWARAYQDLKGDASEVFA